MTVLVGNNGVTPPPPPGLSPPTATTAQEWVDRCRHYLESRQNGERNKLATPYLAGQSTTLQFTQQLRGISPGARLSIGLNTFYVESTDESSKTAVVEAAQDSSVDADADQGARVLVRPKFTDADILRAINDDLASLSSPANGLFAMRTVDLQFRSGIVGYDLPGVTDLIDVYSVRYQGQGSAALRDAPRVHSTDYRLERNEAGFSSGYRLQLFRGGYSGRTVTVSYKAPFTPLLRLDALASTTGLPMGAYDLPPMGAALRLMSGREIIRNDTSSQGDTRRATEVPAGAVYGSTRGLSAQREARMQAEAARLLAAYPVLLS